MYVIGGQKSVRTGAPPFLSPHQCGPVNQGYSPLSQSKHPSADVIWMCRPPSVVVPLVPWPCPALMSAPSWWGGGSPTHAWPIRADFSIIPLSQASHAPSFWPPVFCFVPPMQPWLQLQGIRYWYWAVYLWVFWYQNSLQDHTDSPLNVNQSQGYTTYSCKHAWCPHSSLAAT